MTYGSFTALLKYLKRCSIRTLTLFLLISHQERILDIADEIILLVDGKIRAHGDKEEIMPLVLGNNNNVCEKLQA